MYGGHPKVKVNVKNLAVRLSIHPRLAGRLNGSQVLMVLGALGEMLRSQSSQEAVVTIASLVDQAGQQSRIFANAEATKID